MAWLRLQILSDQGQLCDVVLQRAMLTMAALAQGVEDTLGGYVSHAFFVRLDHLGGSYCEHIFSNEDTRKHLYEVFLGVMDLSRWIRGGNK